MRLKFPLIVLLLVAILGGLSYKTTLANSSDSPQPLEEILPSFGYKSAEAAAREFEKHFKEELKLPLRIPPIQFTHHFGRFTDADGEMNDHFELTMISDQNPQHHFKIEVRPIKYKIPFREEHGLKSLKLENGKDAFYSEKAALGFNLLIFERENWQYIFSIDKDVANIVTADVLVQIANTIDYKVGEG
ncbi:hypothetical protein [Ureibacillus chungkukjangi]|uniref:Uncharacterized protein n=1 Tax=Ureibacillus chungkukjangi TaxID=1202712 RepID=A0A318TPM6_9BACL|nr:hypothetical protein [Ureibacillus chungkukjangi]PYF06812.1 hypothetical protein BJ095_10746 [Ureibacillus chungkukjangi]